MGGQPNKGPARGAPVLAGLGFGEPAKLGLAPGKELGQVCGSSQNRGAFIPAGALGPQF